MIAYENGGSLPSELSEAAFLLRTGWTWSEYEATPDSVVEHMRVLLRAEAEVTKERLREAEHGR